MVADIFRDQFLHSKDRLEVVIFMGNGNQVGDLPVNRLIVIFLHIRNPYLFMERRLRRLFRAKDFLVELFPVTKAGELDIRINKLGIPIAICEGLIHRDKQYLFDHIDKAMKRYNRSGCKDLYIVEYSRNKGFGNFWDNASDALDEYDGIVSIHEENTGLLGVKMIKGTFIWEGQQGNLYYIGINCYNK